MMLETVGQVLMTAAVGGLVTAGGSIIYNRIQLTAIKTEVCNMKDACTTCRSGVDKDLENIYKSVNEHHADSNKHNTASSVEMLKDILKRVTRIEDHMFNGRKKT